LVWATLIKADGALGAIGWSTLASREYAMRRFTWGLVFVAAVGIVFVFALEVIKPLPSTRDLDADLAEVRQEIHNVQIDAERYEAGLIKAMIELRIQMLRQTEAMLNQKRAAWLRRINLNYAVNGSEIAPVSNQELHEIIEEIQQAERKADQSSAETDRFSGGLVQAMARVTAETDRLSISQLRMKFYSAKYGFPIFAPTLQRGPAEQAKEKPGIIVKDKDAL
jgi:hypothetical protein